MTQALLLVDIQNDYFAGGAMTLTNMAAAAANAARLLASFRSQALPVYHVRHHALGQGATFFLPGTPGAQIHSGVQPAQGEPVITKHFPNSFRESELLAHCRQDDVKQLVICGAMSHMCIDATTRAAFDLGFDCTVVEDACATRDLTFQERLVPAAQVHASFMAALAAVYARVVSTQPFLAP